MQDVRPRKKEQEKRKKEKLLSKDNVKQKGKQNQGGLREIGLKVKNKVNRKKRRRKKRNQPTGLVISLLRSLIIKSMIEE